MLSYRFSTLQRYLNLCPHPAYSLISYFLHNYKKLNLDYGLFHLDLDPKFFFSLPPLQSELLCAWTASGAQTEIPSDSISHVINLPINSILVQSANNENSS